MNDSFWDDNNNFDEEMGLDLGSSNEENDTPFSDDGLDCNNADEDNNVEEQFIEPCNQAPQDQEVQSKQVKPQDVEPPKESNSNTSEEKTELLDPFKQEITKAENKQVKQESGSLFAKMPVFEYGGAIEEIENADVTFENLRIEKSDDFPELEDIKKVSWVMEYGSIKKQISKPKDTVIATLKTEIETSKEFLEMLKKAKNKDICCKVKPTIRAQSKGISSYKGVFSSLEEAHESEKMICILPARDGSVYEVRKSPMGTFTTKAEGIKELSEISAGFHSALPLIPYKILAQVIGFFKSLMKNREELEALVHLYWDMQNKEYHVVVPKQSVGKVYVYAKFLLEDSLDDKRYIHYADIHSHNSMPAIFSSVDDRDERATRVYIVIGRLNQYFPEVSVRISNGGRYLPIELSSIVMGIPDEFPEYWSRAVTIEKSKKLLGW